MELNDFINFLRQYNAFEEFQNGLQKRHGDGTTVKNAWDHLNKKSIIDRALSWGSMPSGSGFWSTMNERWKRAYDVGDPIKLKGCKSIW